MNIGIYGGTFDPPHLGHLILAQSAIDALDLDHVLLLPAWRSPFKTDAESLPPLVRAEMVELAVSGNDRLRGEYCEIERGEVSFTVESVRGIHARHPGDTLFLLMGSDTFQDFPLWKDPDEILDLVIPAVAVRPGCELGDAVHSYTEAARVFSMPLIDISSSDIRRRVREGRSIQYLVPWTVQVFIESQGLYRRATSSPL
ncbi:MAG: nicotinate (nicotinamide) nucleotide adenylyltransferase [Bacteroidetes bacterium]|nr:nicotinate (nicotinamide) nucleotide adenylyltransferase [Bacteroidota bacterium]